MGNAGGSLGSGTGGVISTGFMERGGGEGLPGGQGLCLGEASLGLEQFRNDHIRKVDLQAPLVLTSGAGLHAGVLLLLKASVGLERARENVDLSPIP
ncbi:unnamed protein product, partial [Discosporangium mesarthrocarpum]